MNDAQRHELELYRKMLLIRRFEDTCAELYAAEKIRGFLHLYNGEEAVAVGSMCALEPEDAVVATYREHGHALARGLPPGAIMAEMFGRANGCARGRGGSMHLVDVARRFYGGFAIVGGGLPLAVGLALADKLRGLARVTAVYFGDGATEEGEFHESLNLAPLWKLPVLSIGFERTRCTTQTATARRRRSRAGSSEIRSPLSPRASSRKGRSTAQCGSSSSERCPSRSQRPSARPRRAPSSPSATSLGMSTHARCDDARDVSRGRALGAPHRVSPR